MPTSATEWKDSKDDSDLAEELVGEYAGQCVLLFDAELRTLVSI